MYKTFRYCGLMFLSLFACSKDNKLENQFEKKNKAEYLRHYKNVYYLKGSEKKKMTLEFIKNPYEVGNFYSLDILLSNEIIYSGPFKDFIEVYISQALIERTSEMKLVFGKKNECFILTTQHLGRLDKTDNYIQVVFLPQESDWFNFYFSFSQNVKYTKL